MGKVDAEEIDLTPVISMEMEGSPVDFYAS